MSEQQTVVYETAEALQQGQEGEDQPAKRMRILVLETAQDNTEDEKVAELQRRRLSFCADTRIYEYTSAANPDMNPIPVLGFSASLHTSGPTQVVPFDLSSSMGMDYPATSPNLLANFLHINPNDRLETRATATSQAFYVIRGAGSTSTEHGEISWAEGDLFVLPASNESLSHHATEDAAIYWVTDAPLLQYLGVKPTVKKFNPTLFKRDKMLAEVERIKHQPGAEHRNRMGILLGNRTTENSTKTLTHVLWSLLNVLPPHDAQRPHRHNSVAIDLCVSSPGNGVYTLMGPELGEDGWVKNPIRMDWSTGAVFVTPPGWWHSHHNETDQPAWVLPMQDAGLYTHQRTLDIRFSQDPSASSSSSSSSSSTVAKTSSSPSSSSSPDPAKE